jgi:hypothetical protein
VERSVALITDPRRTDSPIGDVREAHPNYMGVMCGRVIQSSAPFNLAIVRYIFGDQRKPRNVRMTSGLLGMAGRTSPTT